MDSLNKFLTVVKRWQIVLRGWMEQYRWGRVFFAAIKAYNDHGCVYMTGSMSFYAVVSLIPLSFLAFYTLTLIIGMQNFNAPMNADTELEKLLNQYLLPDAAAAIVNQVEAIADAGMWKLLGAWWSIPAFVWSGVRFYESLHHVLTTAWGGTEARPFIQRKVWTVFAFIGASFFFGLTIALTTTVTTIEGLEGIDQQFLGISFSVFWLFVAKYLPWLFSIAMFFLLYKFMPNTFVPWRLALYAAVPVGLIWNLSKGLFAGFVVSSGFYRGIYGPMASFVLLMVWIYYSAVIILFGAEYAAAWQQSVDDERRLKLDTELAPER